MKLKDILCLNKVAHGNFANVYLVKTATSD